MSAREPIFESDEKRMASREEDRRGVVFDGDPDLRTASQVRVRMPAGRRSVLGTVAGAMLAGRPGRVEAPRKGERLVTDRCRKGRGRGRVLTERGGRPSRWGPTWRPS